MQLFRVGTKLLGCRQVLHPLQEFVTPITQHGAMDGDCVFLLTSNRKYFAWLGG